MDDFNGDNAKLVECINALLSMDEAGALRPHGVGGHGRKLLEAAASRLQALSHAAGQDGEQCRAASGVPSVLDLAKMELAVTAALFNYEAGDSISERLKQTADLLRALSRGVPEGNQDVAAARRERDEMREETPALASSDSAAHAPAWEHPPGSTPGSGPIGASGNVDEARKVVAHRLHTPGGKWQWIDGEPSLGTLDLWKSYGWTLEYAYAGPDQAAMGG